MLLLLETGSIFVTNESEATVAHSLCPAKPLEQSISLWNWSSSPSLSFARGTILHWTLQKPILSRDAFPIQYFRYNFLDIILPQLSTLAFRSHDEWKFSIVFIWAIQSLLSIYGLLLFLLAVNLLISRRVLGFVIVNGGFECLGLPLIWKIEYTSQFGSRYWINTWYSRLWALLGM